MRDKITKLSKGITDIEAPVMRIIPEFFSDAVVADEVKGFVLELASDNNTAIKGICFCDDPRISTTPKSFAGRRVHLSVGFDASGLKSGDRANGVLTLVTNGGEIAVPYEFEVAGQSGAGLRADVTTKLIRNPLSFELGSRTPDSLGDKKHSQIEERYRDISGSDSDTHSLSGRNNSSNTDGNSSDYNADDNRWNRVIRDSVDRSRDESKEDADDTADAARTRLESELSELIRAEDTSAYAFRLYGEAIKRGISVTGLYESYVSAFPDDSDEEMPREVYIYFSYETNAEHNILKKLYRNILTHLDKDSELYMIYERAISNFAISCSKKLMIDDALAVIYDRMIYPGMIDVRAAEDLPDIFKCRRIEIKEGSADYLTVSYKGLEVSMRSDITAGITFVPIYFKDAKLRFYKYSGLNDALEVTDDIRYDSTELFNRPDIIRRCFELMPEHRMLLLSAAREIAKRGLNSEEEIAVVQRAFNELDISQNLRNSLFDKLCEHGNPSSWGEELVKDEDYKSTVGRKLFKTLCRGGKSEAESDAEQDGASDTFLDTDKALKIIKLTGADRLDAADVGKVVSCIISDGLVPMDEQGVSPYFVTLSKYVFDQGAAGRTIEDFLTREYEGSSEAMYALMTSRMRHGADLGNLPEKILTVKLFSDTKEHIDESFETYIAKCSYTELLIKAYLTARCADAFLYEEQVGAVMYEALRSLFRNTADPISLPLIYRLTLTAHFADMEKLDEDETKLCQTLSDDLIAMGLIFRYTKKLRKKIAVPADICSRYYVQFNASGNETPRLLTRILPDNEQYRLTDMRRVYKNIFIMSTTLFKGDELQYIIYNSEQDSAPAAEGSISVRKYHRQTDTVTAALDKMSKALEEKDIDELETLMLEYVKRTEASKLLFDLEK